MKCLVIHTAFIGDIVLSTPLLQKIKEKYPKASLYYLSTPQGASVLANNPGIDKILVYDKKGKDRTWKAFFQIWKKLRGEKFDLVFCPHRYLRSMLLATTIGAKEIISYNVAPLSFLATKKIPYDKEKHEVERLLAFVEGEEDRRYEISLYPSKEDCSLYESLEEVGRNYRYRIAIAPGSKWETKRWPLEYFQQVIESLQRNGNFMIVLVGGKEEQELPLVLGKHVWDFRGKTSLLELTSLLQGMDFVLSNDSSPLHIASSSSKPFILALFGPTTKEMGFRPWSRNSLVLEEEHLDCRPCGLHGSHHCPQKHFRCMRDLLPKRVLDALEEEIRKRTEEESKK